MPGCGCTLTFREAIYRVPLHNKHAYLLAGSLDSYQETYATTRPPSNYEGMGQLMRVVAGLSLDLPCRQSNADWCCAVQKLGIFCELCVYSMLRYSRQQKANKPQACSSNAGSLQPTPSELLQSHHDLVLPPCCLSCRHVLQQRS